MNIKNKLVIALLISVFILSVSAVVAEDVADGDELAIDNAGETIAVTEDNDEPLAAEENKETLTAEQNDETLTAAASDEATDVDIKVVVLTKILKWETRLELNLF